MQFSNKAVNDLAWAIQSAPLLQGDAFLTAAWFEQHYKADYEFLLALDKQPEPLTVFLGQKANKRLGKYFERLLEFWFRHSKQFELLSHNQQFFSGKRTVGEIDFLVYDKLWAEHMHIETAVKFYLQTNNSDNLMHWLGPNAKDRLRLKYDKLLGQQLGLLQQTLAHDFLATFGLAAVRPLAYCKGYYFYHKNSKIANTPQVFHPEHAKAWWLYQHEFAEHAAADLLYLPLEKYDWFSTFAKHNVHPLRAPEVTQWLHERMAVVGQTTMLVVYSPQADNELSRGFVVPNHWPKL